MNWKPVVEAIIYVTEDPVTAEQVANALTAMGVEDPPGKNEVASLIQELIADYQSDTRGIEIKEVAGGFKMATKAEHHEAARQFVKSLKPPVKLSLAALETLAVIAYRQPVTVPEIQEVRGVNAAGVIKTLLDKKLIITAGRKEVIGRPVLYRTTRDFLVQFGLKDLSELPSLKEFEELSKAAMLDTEAVEEPVAESGELAFEEQPEEGASEERAGEERQPGEGAAGDSSEPPSASSPEIETTATVDEHPGSEAAEEEKREEATPASDTTAT